MSQYLFHGGCCGCTNNLDVCPTCQYMLPDWSLPDKNPVNIKHKQEEDDMIAKAISLREIKKAMKG